MIHVEIQNAHRQRRFSINTDSIRIKREFVIKKINQNSGLKEEYVKGVFSIAPSYWPSAAGA